MKTGRIIESIGGLESVSTDIVEELHQLIHENGLGAAKPIGPTWQYKASGLTLVRTTDEKNRCGIADAVLEDMYRFYISSGRTPVLTFSEYATVLERLAGPHAA